MSFKDQKWVSRFDALGDEAEGIFEHVYPNNVVRFGLNRPPINLQQVPPKIRYAPDYLTAKGLVEVQGFGRDQVVKVKYEKLGALLEWEDDFRCDLFLWDKTNQRYGFVRLGELIIALKLNGSMDRFHDGPHYAALNADLVPVTYGKWTEFDPSTIDQEGAAA